jgi:hypothetical protein
VAPGETWELDLESASGIFGCLGGLVDNTYDRTIEYVQKAWSDFEDEQKYRFFPNFFMLLFFLSLLRQSACQVGGRACNFLRNFH